MTRTAVTFSLLLLIASCSRPTRTHRYSHPDAGVRLPPLNPLAPLPSSIAAAQGDGGLARLPLADAGVRRELPAEVEISGRIRSPFKPVQLTAYVSREPCDPAKPFAGLIRSVQIDPNVSMNFFTEIFVPQGSTGYICAAARDAQGKVVAFGANPGNPVTFRGQGEVTVSGLVIELRPLKSEKPKHKKHHSNRRRRRR